MIGSFLCILKNKVFIYMFILKCRIILVLVRLRCSCWGTIGALASVVLLFLNARPVVSDELARSLKESIATTILFMFVTD